MHLDSDPQPDAVPDIRHPSSWVTRATPGFLAPLNKPRPEFASCLRKGVEGVRKRGSLPGVWPPPPVFPALPGTPRKSTIQSAASPGYGPCLRLLPRCCSAGRTPGGRRSPRRTRDAAVTRQLPDAAQGHPLAAPAGPRPPGAPPGVQRWPPLALGEWPGSPAGAQRREGGQRMRRLRPGRGGRRALPGSGGRRPARYSRRAWRGRARSRPRAPGRASAAGTLRSGVSEAPQRRPLLRSPRSTISLRRLRGRRPARHRRGQSARGLCSQSGRGAGEDAGRRYPGLRRGGGAARGAQVAVETASLPSGAPGLEGPSNCSLETENLMLLFAAAPHPGKVRKC